MDTRPPAAADPPPGRPAGDADEPPPILGSWKALYALVAAELLLVIAFCGWLTGRGR